MVIKCHWDENGRFAQEQQENFTRSVFFVLVNLDENNATFMSVTFSLLFNFL